MLEDLGSGQTGHFIVAFTVVGLGLLALFALVWFIRGRSNSTFIRGGKNRQPRLAVLDAAPVDTRRRLVLVRRDDMEHLILIGGPTDVVIESGIATDAESALLDRAPADSRSTSMPARNEPDIANEPSETQPARAQEARSPAMVAALTTATRPPQAEPVREARTEPVRDPAPAPAPKPEIQKAVSIAPAREAAPAARQPASVVAAFPHKKDESHEALDVLDAARGRVLSPATDPDTAAMDAANGPQTAYQEFEAAEPVYKTPEPQKLTPQPAHTAAAQVAVVPRTIQAPSPAQQSIQPSARVQLGGERNNQSEFEAILEEELSGDFEMDDLGLGEELLREETNVRRDGDLSSVSPAAPQATTAAPSPTVDPTRDRSRDTLEDEMNKLLGDLTRRN